MLLPPPPLISIFNYLAARCYSNQVLPNNITRNIYMAEISTLFYYTMHIQKKILLLTISFSLLRHITLLDKWHRERQKQTTCAKGNIKNILWKIRENALLYLVYSSYY
jgi:hypothetical protein